MPATTEYVRDGRGFHLRATGSVAGEDLVNVALGLEADPVRLRGLRFMLADMSGVTEFLMTTEHVRRIADADRRMALVVPSMCVAIVAARDDTFGLARMWEVMAEPTGWATRVFRDAASADAWIEEQLAAG